MKRLTMKQKIGIAAVSIIAVVLIAVTLGRLGIQPFATLIKITDDDEAPIIVRNGSMDFVIQDAKDGRWENNNNASWSYETPADKVHKNKFWVRADLNDRSHCDGDGNVVRVDYSQAGFQAVFTPGRGKDGSTIRTQVVPKPKIFYVDDLHLQHPQQNDGGFISGVTVDGQPLKNGKADCTITKDNLNRIAVCSNSTKCQ